MPDAQREKHTLVAAVLVALWLGAALLFAGAVAPAAFSVLPSRSLAGALVGRILPIIFVLGMVIGAATVVLELRPPRLVHWLGRSIGGALVAAACGIAQLGIAPRIARVRAASAVTLDSLPEGDATRAAFGRLHAMSVGWLGVAILGACAILVLAWLGIRERALARPDR